MEINFDKAKNEAGKEDKKNKRGENMVYLRKH